MATFYVVNVSYSMFEMYEGFAVVQLVVSENILVQLQQFCKLVNWSFSLYIVLHILLLKVKDECRSSVTV